ncbi:hypothetical protein [Caproicibacter sp.]|uniref:hypothetical protein n=1 Tax=Caproicibacter sp. TaxID=2814884 RepID=UPI00398927FE
MAVVDGASLKVVKTKGKLRDLKDKIHKFGDLKGTVGIGHTRCATHGEPLDVNAHPQFSGSEMFAVVHNGIIENYRTLKDSLIYMGFHFISDTDTEVVAQLLEFYYEESVLEAVSKTIQKIEGSYALAILCRNLPDHIIAVCKNSPMIVGIGKNENFVTSDIPAVLSRTRDVYYLNENEIAVVAKGEIKFYDLDGNAIRKETYPIS